MFYFLFGSNASADVITEIASILIFEQGNTRHIYPVRVISTSCDLNSGYYHIFLLLLILLRIGSM